MAALSDGQLMTKCVFFIQQYDKSAPSKTQFLEQLKYNERSRNSLQNHTTLLPLFKNAMKLASDVLLDISFLVDDSMKTPCKLMIEDIILPTVIRNRYGQPLFCPIDGLKELLLKQRTQPAKERRLYDFFYLFSYFFGENQGYQRSNQNQ
ncbi:unnamed protein product [Absidia cylindrospora]